LKAQSAPPDHDQLASAILIALTLAGTLPDGVIQVDLPEI
jgi:hypothetical protein